MAAAGDAAADAAVSAGNGEQAGAGAPRKRIGTHNGTFHCDEAMGCFLLRRTAKFRDADVIRTRDEKVLAELDAVIDVGGVYDPVTDRYDHHQRGFSEVFGHGFCTKLSSAGLVYKHYGQEVVAGLMGLPQTHADVHKVYLAIYRSFMEALDAIDNGVNQFESEYPPRYVNNTHLSARVGRFNPDWLDDASPAAQDAAFQKAMALAGEEFMEAVTYTARSWLPARSIVEESIASAVAEHGSVEIITLKQFCPWKGHLSELEGELKLNPLPKYMLYEDDRAKQWRVQAISVAPGSFESRCPLPVDWRGLRDDELSERSGIPRGVFVHMSGFIGGNHTYEGALAMAKAGLAEAAATDAAKAAEAAGAAAATVA
ncbi:unnamed protein product [Closterium sp. Yama58-4]|nr:unnamed protein product [Closterium sp. Yama58-4]